MVISHMQINIISLAGQLLVFKISRTNKGGGGILKSFMHEERYLKEVSAGA